MFINLPRGTPNVSAYLSFTLYASVALSQSSLTHLGYLHESVPEAASVPLEAERQLGEVPLQGPRKYTTNGEN